MFLWDVSTGTTTRRLSGHMGKIYVVDFNEDSTVVASGEGHYAHIQRITESISGSFDSTVRLWDLRLVSLENCKSQTLTGRSSQNRAPIQVLDEARDAVQTLHVGSTYILAGSVDGHIRTYDLRMGELRSDFIGSGSTLLIYILLQLKHPVTDPVGSVIPTQDSQTYLAATLDGHIRLMDCSTGKMLNDFTSHTNESYRIRACFGHAEASVVCGDENGQIWAWDLLDVGRLFILHYPPTSYICYRHRPSSCSPICHQRSTKKSSHGLSITRSMLAKC